MEGLMAMGRNLGLELGAGGRDWTSTHWGGLGEGLAELVRYKIQ